MSETIVFFGSGPVAARSLEYLSKIFEIEAVITKPKPANHKEDFPVLKTANQLGLKISTVTDKQTLDLVFSDKPFRSKLGILIDFGIIVSQEVIDYFPKGIINSHFSLLPEWRGADPITAAILSGQKRTGVSLMLLTAGLDEGPILAQLPCDIDNKPDSDQLTDELVEISAEGLRIITPLWLNSEIEALPQDAGTLASSMEPTYSRKLTKADGQLDWTKPAIQLEREVRAYHNWPKSHLDIGGIDVIVTKASVLPGRPNQEKPGTLMESPDHQTIELVSSDGFLSIERLKPAGKNEMTAKAFLVGYGSKIGF